MHVAGKPKPTTTRESATLWSDVWKELSQHNLSDTNFDTAHSQEQLHRFNTWYADLKSSDVSTRIRHKIDRPFKTKEIARVLKKLKPFKRYGSDGLPADLFIHGTNLLVKAITMTQNFYLLHGVHPSTWNATPAMPLYKKCRKNDPLNYRLIAFMDTMCKIYDSSLAQRLTIWAHQHNLISPTQYGYRGKTETIDMWYVYLHAIRERAAAGLPTFLASLDVQKAFPSVPRYFIWNILYDAGLRGHLLLALIDMSESALLWLLVPGMTAADAHALLQGVREGSVTSPILYLIFVNATIRILEAANVGIDIHGIYTGSSLFADDLSLLLAEIPELNRALAILTEHGYRTRTMYNAKKTTIVIFGESAHDSLLRQLWPESLGIITMGDLVLTPSTILQLLGIRATNTLSFMPQLQHVLSLIPKYTDDLKQAGAHSTGLDTRTAVSLWKIIFTALFKYGLNIWFEPSMTRQLNEQLFKPLLQSLAGPHFRLLKPSHTHILIAELALLPIEQLYSRSLLAHEARLRFKPDSNPAARLHKALNSLPFEHDSVADIRERMEELDLKPSHMASEYWTDILTTQLTTQAKQIAHANPLQSHNIETSKHLHAQHAPTYDKPFYRTYLKSRNVLRLRLQMAPLATLFFDDPTALCHRCYQAPDTFQHWLWHCNALQTPRLLLNTRIIAWAHLFDTAINSRKCSSATGRWRSYSALTRDLALQGTITAQLQATFTANPTPFEDPTDPNPVTYIKDDVLMSKLVFILETYAKLTERTCTLALYGPTQSFAF